MSVQVGFSAGAKMAGGLKKTGQARRMIKTVKGPANEIKLSPSAYLADMRMKTEEKLALTCEVYPPKIVGLLDITSMSHNKDTHLSIDQALFQPFPSEIVFQQFEPHLVYEFPLQLRNLDRVARHIKVVSVESPYFSVACQKTAGVKVAPGMELMYTVYFRPEEKKDYEHELLCITEREKFVIPVRATGARALLDLPDDIRFNLAPVKYPSTKTMLMRNIGDAEAKFTMDADKPFSVSPGTGTLEVGSCMQVSVFYQPREVGDHSAELRTTYSSGETVYTRLYGCSKDVNIYLDRSSVIFDDTFSGLSSQRSVLLHNRSDVVVKFQWKYCSNETEEQVHREKLLTQYGMEERLSKDAFYQSCVHNPTIRDRLPILTRTLDLNKKKYSDLEQFLFFDEVFSIDPLEGEIWPNSQAEVTVFFRPDSCDHFSRLAYCDVVGREARLPLKLKGEGMGPKCLFSFDTLDIQSVFVNSSHAYEVILRNTGSIDATFSLVPPTSMFGPKFTFAPSSGTLAPDSLQAIQISFCSRELGEFHEEFRWEVQGSRKSLVLNIHGTVIGPTFQFDMAHVKFGRISSGFTTHKKVLLSNTSEIPMTFNLRIGDEDRILQEQQEQKNGSQRAAAPSDFVVLPHSGTLPPNFQLPIEINLTPSSSRTYSTSLILSLQETNGDVFSLPVLAKSVVPKVTSTTPRLDLRRCFLDYPYKKTIKLVNDSAFLARYEILGPAEEEEEEAGIAYSTEEPVGVIDPCSTLEIPMLFEAKSTGVQFTSVSLSIHHSTDPPLKVEVQCIGEGPVIFVDPVSLDWGTIPVLTPINKKLTITNQSLIPAYIEGIMFNERTVYSVSPLSAEVPPEASIELVVTAFLDDHLRFTDKLSIRVLRGVNFTIPLKGAGIGTTIVSEPPLLPGVKLGTYFSHGVCKNTFVLTNRGRRTQALSWSTDGFSASQLKKAEMYIRRQDPNDIKVRQRLQLMVSEEGNEVLKKPVFQVVPDKMVLDPLQSSTIVIMGQVEEPDDVKERLVCHAIIGKNPHKERIMTVDIAATFINPLVEFTSQHVSFCVDQPPGSKLVYHTKEVGVRNVGHLPVTAHFSLPYPFCLMRGETALANMDLKLAAQEVSNLCILYDSTYCKDLVSRLEQTTMTVAYREHPQKDQIILKAEIRFPNLVFNRSEIDFGCILNDIEVNDLAIMTNPGPLPVKYTWYFINRPPIVRGKDLLDDEGVDMESDYDSPEEEIPHGGEWEVEEEEEGKEAGGQEKENGSEKGDEEREVLEENDYEESKVKVQSGDQQTSGIGGEPRDSSKTDADTKSEEIGTEKGAEIEKPEEPEVKGATGESHSSTQDTVGSTTATSSSGGRIKKKKKKRPREVWRNAKDPFKPIPISQVFDIMPLHGTLAPGDVQPVEFMFFGHAEITADVTAACKVEGGPVYEIRLQGEASKMRYKFSERTLDLGLVMYDQIHFTNLALHNKGKVNFNFSILSENKEGNSTWLPGDLTVQPRRGRLGALSSVEFAIFFLPGTPENFTKLVQFQVAHFPVDTVKLVGKATYPKMTINLERDFSQVPAEILDEAKKNVAQLQKLEVAKEGGEDKGSCSSVASDQQVLEDELELLLIKKFSSVNASKLFNRNGKNKAPKMSFPPYVLDFGFVEYGSIKTHIITVTNNGHVPISFPSGREALHLTGFKCDMPEKVRALPPGEKLEVMVRFDPSMLVVKDGEATASLFFNLTDGPRYSVLLRGMAALPRMEISMTELDFGTVVCGQCKVITLRITNTQPVSCEWKAIADKAPKPIPKHVPQHLRKKMREKPPPKYFEVRPASGRLMPGEAKNIWVRFVPSEEMKYSEEIPVAIRQNPDFHLVLSVTGAGEEPEIAFSSAVLQFGPLLPFSPGVTREVTVTNPTANPVEFYSLEFDSQYHEEEEIIAWLKDYFVPEKHLLLPPYQPGATLPPEVMDSHHAAKEKAKDQDDSQGPSEINIADASSYISIDQQTDGGPRKGSGEAVGTYEVKSGQSQSSSSRSIDSSASSLYRITDATSFHFPAETDRTIDGFCVEEALARHVGVDITKDGLEAEKRRGITIVVHGPALSGKTTEAKALAQYYQGQVLDLDCILIEAISSAKTEAGQKARTYCYQAKPETIPDPPQAPVYKKQVAISKDKDKDKDKDSQQQVDTVTYLKLPVLFQIDPHLDTPYAVPEGTLMPTIIPEDYFVEILVDRFAQVDCLKAVVLDGMESSFSSNSLPLILRAFNNRTHIYFIHLDIELDDIKDRQDEIEHQRMLKIKEEEEKKKAAMEREEQRILALLNMDEDEYEALAEEKREEIDAIRLKRKKTLRLKKQRVKDEKLRLEREKREEEERVREEEKKKKGKKEKKAPSKLHIAGGQGGGVVLPSRSGSVLSTVAPSPMHGPGTDSRTSMISPAESPALGQHATPRHLKVKRKLSPKSTAGEVESDAFMFEKGFNNYKLGLMGLKSILEDWDRQKGVTKFKKVDEDTKTTPNRRPKGSKSKEQEPVVAQEDPHEVEESQEGLGIPFIDIKGKQPEKDLLEAILGSLPTSGDILEGLGLGPSGTPIPSSVTLQVCPFPLRRAPVKQESRIFNFITTSPDDPNGPPKAVVVESVIVEPPDEKKASMSRLSRRSTRPESDQKKSARKKPIIKDRNQTSSPFNSSLTHLPESPEPGIKDGHVKLVKFRWTIPPYDEIKLKMVFKSDDVGHFDFTLNFEIVGTKRRYQLFCRGICDVPRICWEPRMVFPKTKNVVSGNEILHKCFVEKERKYYFGPLHCGKTRERYKECRYPENAESLTITNDSFFDLDVAFYFLHDHNGSTFLLDPSEMSLQRGETKTLNIWAYPKNVGKVEDSVVFCVKNNPRPEYFHVITHGAEPEIKLEKKLVEFKKVLLHRKQMTVLRMLNKTLIPVAWKLGGLDQLGDEFNFSQDHGIIQPLSEFPLGINFRASKPVNYPKKNFKIEVSDVEQVMGLMHVESVQVVAESYDVAIDVSFPRGTDGGLDFQCIKVGDEIKLMLQIKNKGKYDVAYNIQFDDSVGTQGVQSYRCFHIQPSHSNLYPNDKPHTVAITFRPDKEVEFKNVNIFKIQVVDIHLGEQGEVIANIPIRVRAKALYSHYTVCPTDDVNLGSMMVNSKSHAFFTIHNQGVFEFKYAINKQLTEDQQKQRAVNMAAAAAKVRVKSRERVSSAISKPKALAKKNDLPQRTEVLTGPQKLILGMYSISPAFGAILPGQTQTITVDCIADKPGLNHENLAIEISDLPRETPPINYRISGEVLVPGIEANDAGLIFEEHRVCKKLGALGQHLFHEQECVGVYGEEDKKFVFKGVIVGKTSVARFRIANPNKIPCEVSINTKAIVSKSKVLENPFEVLEPSSKVTISPRSSVYAKVQFCPTAMLTYSAMFEVTTDHPKVKLLTFELQGEGNLPQVTVVQPTLRNSKGVACMLFQQLSLQSSQALPLCLRNTGTILSRVKLHVIGSPEAFQVCSYSSELPDDGPPVSPVCFDLEPGAERECLAQFTPQVVKKYRGELRLTVEDNIFERQQIQLIGEGYQDSISITNIRGMADSRPVEAEEAGEEMEASRNPEIHFGVLPLGEIKRVTFTLSNQASSSVLRFQWVGIPSISFIPSVGHIKPKSSKDVTISFNSAKPLSLKGQKVVGRMSRISYPCPISEVPDWDDSMKSIHWVSVPPPGSTPTPTNPTGLEETSHSSTSAYALASSTVHKASKSAATSMSGPPRVSTPAKKKVEEVEKEPSHVAIEDTGRDIELLVTGLTDYAKYECSIKSIKFKDTLMYQTRVYTFPLKNTSTTYLEYEWLVLREDGSPPTPPPSQLHLDESGNLLGEGGTAIPFSVEPSSGVLTPETEGQITVRFSPLDVMKANYLLRCQISNLEASSSVLELPVSGTSLMPLCHFELESSDYLDECVSNTLVAGAVVDHSNTRVLEFSVHGVGVVSTKKFNVINPTNCSYEFVWAEEVTDVIQPFVCHTREGVIEAGMKYEMVFEYKSSSLEVVESCWTFSVPSLGLSNTFLCVGQTMEPAVDFDRSYLSFKSPLLLGVVAKETVYIINNEEAPYHFSILEKSLYAEGHEGLLQVSPTEGTVPAKSRLPLEIRFTAKQQLDYSFSLKCKVKRKMSALTMKVKAEGYSIEFGLSHSAPGKEAVDFPIGQRDSRVLNLGAVQINEKRVELLNLTNRSLYNFEYRWSITTQSSRRHVSMLSIEPQSGEVIPTGKQACHLTFLPTSNATLNNCKLLLEIINGPKLPITLEGRGEEPMVNFSYLEHDFGPCILYKTTENPIPRSVLVISNGGESDVTIHCLYESKPHLKVRFRSTVLIPGCSTEAIIEFKPQKVTKHSEAVTFEINGCYHKVVTIKGEGAKMKIELANPVQKTVNLGVLQIGNKKKNQCSKTVGIVNRSPSDLRPIFTFAPSLRVPALQQEYIVTIEPAGEVLLKANDGTCNVIVTFKPTSRVPHFSEPVKLECLGFSESLFVLTGSCQGLEVSLDTDHIPFGAVMQDSCSSRKLCMLNTGDIGATFHWEQDQFGPEFSISPSEGFISSGKQIPMTVNFHPRMLQADVRKTGLRCAVEGLEAPLTITLSGMCIEKVPFKDTLQFTTHVRSKETKHLTISNKSHLSAVIKPILDGEYWSGPESFHIGPNQSHPYELTYTPLEMTTEVHKHSGTAFFPLPDGSGILYHLQGVAEAPKQVAYITQEVPCKTPHTELLSVENWLTRPQRFMVRRDILKPEKVDHTTSLDGLDYIDVPALGKKDYQLHFNSFKECAISGRVTFKNEETGEYIIFGFHFKATAPGILQTFYLETPVRQSVSQFVRIVNPFNLPATMSTSCNVPEITIPSSFILGASSSGGCMFEYLPLKVGETVGKLTFQCSELGTYQYELRLTGKPGPAEKAVHFTTHLGASQHQVCRFTNYAKGRTEYICKVTSNDFSVEKSITVAGSEANADVTFEPSHQGDCQAELHASSSSGGDYVIPLYGHCLSPKPQGPFTIKSGHPITIHFKNVYHQFTQYRFVVDNPCFTVNKSLETIKPRKSHSITVSYEGKHAEGLKVGKLIVSVFRGLKSESKTFSQSSSAKKATQSQGDVSWVYYLKGVTN